MSKILTVLFTALVLSTAQAKEIVTIIYPFSAADTMANWARAFAEESNKSQDKYQFLVDFKPGAGNSIAANYVLNTPNTILFTSSAFYVRPVFYPNESYNVDDFRQLLPMCTAPLAVTSLKYNSWKDVPTNKPLNIGTSGLGVTTHLAALQIVNRYPNMQVVPFKSTNDTVLAVAGNQIDFAMSFMGEADEWSKPANKIRLNVLGITGNTKVNGRPLLADQNFGTIVKEMSVPHHLLVSKKMPDSKYTDIQKTFIGVSHNTAVLNAYKSDHCQVIDVNSQAAVDAWNYTQRKFWENLAISAKASLERNK